MNRTDLIELITNKQPHLHKYDVDFAVKQIVTELSESLSKGKRIEIRGFGSFNLIKREARITRNPKKLENPCF